MVERREPVIVSTPLTSLCPEPMTIIVPVRSSFEHLRLVAAQFTIRRRLVPVENVLEANALRVVVALCGAPLSEKRH